MNVKCNLCDGIFDKDKDPGFCLTSERLIQETSFPTTVCKNCAVWLNDNWNWVRNIGSVPGHRADIISVCRDRMHNDRRPDAKLVVKEGVKFAG